MVLVGWIKIQAKKITSGFAGIEKNFCGREKRKISDEFLKSFLQKVYGKKSVFAGVLITIPRAQMGARR